MSNLISKFLNELFYALTGGLVIFAIMELARPKIILAYFNLNWLLLFWLIVGIIIVLVGKKNGTE